MAILIHLTNLELGYIVTLKCCFIVPCKCLGVIFIASIINSADFIKRLSIILSCLLYVVFCDGNKIPPFFFEYDKVSQF
jgi:hypothetical protein